MAEKESVAELELSSHDVTPTPWAEASGPDRMRCHEWAAAIGRRASGVGLVHREPERARSIVERWLAPGGEVFVFFDTPSGPGAS